MPDQVALASANGPSLTDERLGTPPDLRKRCGARHPFVVVLLIAACELTADSRSWTAIGHWARLAPHDTLAGPAPSRSARLSHRPPSGA
ncbi:transposase family protein [Streptomyces sp. MUM 2J]|nr:transposase family protein [Streptomyces sp. MUM 2J]